MEFKLFAFLFFVVAQIMAQKCKPLSLSQGIVTNCGGSKDAFYLKNVKIVGKPTKGRPLKIRVVGALRERLTKGARVFIKVKYNGLTLLDLKKDLCELLIERKTGYKCPVNPRKVDKTMNLPIPSYAPSGKYNIEAYGFNKNNRRIFKINIQTTL